MSNGDDLLNQRLENASGVETYPQDTAEKPATPNAMRIGLGSRTTFDYVQWSAEPNETFRPSGQRRETLPSGVYSIIEDDRGMFFARRSIVSDHLIELDESASIQVLQGIRVFWSSKHEYVKRSIVYKRGIFLWGPAGSGKTATLMLLTNELIRNDGIVVLCDSPGLATAGLMSLRRIEPDRPVITILEDIDELIHRYGEHSILALLDGESQISNVVNIATTNYPERLGARIINRPSRFDERIFIDMPNESSRRRYLLHATRNESVCRDELERWVRETSGFSVAHLRELVVAVFCLKQEYRSVLDRLSKMRVQPQSRSEMRSHELLGFQTAQTAKGAN